MAGTTTYGTPQGSILGPILFTLFINDIPEGLFNPCKIFADDAKLYRPILSKGDASSLQKDIDSLVQWSAIWQLPFNVDKCKCMRIGKENNAHTYHMNQQPLHNVKEEKDLGVIIDNRIKFHTHTSSAIKKANKILGLIKHTFKALDETTLSLLYTSIVRPHLEYGNIIWGPHFKEDIKSIEKVQKRATRMISRIKEFSYTKRLFKL